MTIQSKHYDWGILEVASINADSISEEVMLFHNEWLLDTSRQETFMAHQHTFAYKLLDFDLAWSPGKPSEVKQINQLSEKSQNELDKIYALIESYCGGKVVYAEIINMKPRSRIKTHKDRGDLMYVARRFHIPIKTNPDTFFIVNEKKYHLDFGKIYELNNIQYHSVKNNSDEYRIHLIVDVLPQKYCENVKVLNG